MTNIIFGQSRVQLRSYDEEDDGVSFLICETDDDYGVAWFDSLAELFDFAEAILKWRDGDST